MLTRNVFGLAGISICLLFGSAYAAETTDKPAKKTASAQLAERKASHPCARKSVNELNKKAAPFQKSIHTYSGKYGVDADLVKSVITIESCYKQKALSPKGAQGLMQLIPATAERFGISDAYDTDQNVRGGTQYLGWLSQRFKGDLHKVLAGYNAGEGRVDRYKGIPPFRETRNYVHDVLLVYKKFKTQKKRIAQAAEAKHQARLAQEYKKKQQARQQQIRLAEQRKLAALTPDQRKRIARQAQLARQVRQRQQSERQKQLVIKMRQREQNNRQAALAGNPKPKAPQHNKANNTVDRVKRVYTSPVKPGRAGWQANKRRAPHLYKQ